MQYGFVLPPTDLTVILELTRAIEDAGWDAAFTWDGLYTTPEQPILDPWVTMTAMALATSRVQIGAMVLPLSRRRPWKVARETATLDQLANGRLVLPVALGAVDAFGPFPEATDRKTRAELLDETLAILTGLWSGQPFSFSGKHYQFPEVTFLPTPARPGGVPIWVVGALGSDRSLARALRYAGVIVTKRGASGAFGAAPTPDDLRALGAYIAAHRTASTPLEVIVEGQTPIGDRAAAAAQVQPLAEAGGTWWIESPWATQNTVAELRARIAQGPPRP